MRWLIMIYDNNNNNNSLYFQRVTHLAEIQANLPWGPLFTVYTTMLNAMKEKSYNTTYYHVKNIDIPANT